MSKCIICRMGLSCLQTTGVCTQCEAQIPQGVLDLARGRASSYLEGSSYPHPNANRGFLFTQNNWIFHSKVVKRRNEVNRAIQVNYISTFNGITSTTKLKVLFSYPVHNIMICSDGRFAYTLDIEHRTNLPLRVWNLPGLPDKEDPNAGKVYNPISGEWKWL